jgi:formate hydrogenlyase subunit 3/multisubunit Na+/H+ antiporter MnhD subunit
MLRALQYKSLNDGWSRMKLRKVGFMLGSLSQYCWPHVNMFCKVMLLLQGFSFQCGFVIIGFVYSEAG